MLFPRGINRAGPAVSTGPPVPSSRPGAGPVVSNGPPVPQFRPSPASPITTTNGPAVPQRPRPNAKPIIPDRVSPNSSYMSESPTSNLTIRQPPSIPNNVKPIIPDRISPNSSYMSESSTSNSNSSNNNNNSTIRPVVPNLSRTNPITITTPPIPASRPSPITSFFNSGKSSVNNSPVVPIRPIISNDADNSPINSIDTNNDSYFEGKLINNNNYNRNNN